MADKRSVKRQIRWLKRVKTWQLIILLVLSLFVTATFLRINNVNMAQRYNAVLAADKEGNQVNIRNRIISLQHYVSKHMNTEMDVLYLEHQYKRDSKKLIDAAVKKSKKDNVNINAKVDAICKPRYSGYTQGYVDCFNREFSKFSPGSNPVSDVELPDVEKYRYSFISPLWSADFAGFSLLVSLTIFALIVFRALGLLFLHILLKVRYRRG